MAFQVSPGVSVSEVDLSTTIPTASVSDAGFAGYFSKGPVNQIVNIGSENDLVNIFGKPNSNNNSNWLAVSSFLAYGGSINIVRLLDSSGRSANSGAGADTDGTFVASDSTGEWATDTAVTITPLATGTEDGWSIVYAVAADGTLTGTVSAAAGTTLTDSFNTKISGADSTVAYITVDPSTLTSVTTLFSNIAEVETATANLTNVGVNSDIGTPTASSLVVSNDILISGVASTVANSGSALVLGPAGVTQQSAVIVITKNSPVTVKNKAEFEAAYDSNTASFEFVASNPGAWANNLQVKFDISTDSKLGKLTSAEVTAGEAHLQVVTVNDDDVIVDVLETHTYVHMTDDGSTDVQGNNNYYKNVLNTQSAYVFAGNTDITLAAETLKFDLDDGVDGYSTSARSYDLFKDTEQVDLSLVITGTGESNDNTTSLASERKDCVAFVSPKKTSVVSVDSMSAKADKVYADKPSKLDSYGFMDSGWKKMYDKYNDIWVNVPLNGDIAGLCVATDTNRDPWYSPAGFNRGQVRNCAGLLFDPNQTTRDTLYKDNINPVASFPGEGYILFGDKTLQTKPSAFDRLNVRRLFIVLEKAIASAAKYSLFEFNDEFTRGQFRSMVDPFLRDVKARRGIQDYLLVCDDSNNTPDIVDKNEFVGDIFIKPSRSINFIQLNFVAVKSGVSFQEIVGAV